MGVSILYIWDGVAALRFVAVGNRQTLARRSRCPCMGILQVSAF